MHKQSIHATIKAAIGILILMGCGVAMAAPLNVPDIAPNSPATSSGMNQLFNTVEGSVNDNDSRVTSLEQRLVPLEDSLNGNTVPVDCTGANSAALKNLTLTPNTTYVLTGICDGQIIVGAGLGTINIEGDATGTKDDGITLPPGETDPDTVFAAIYGNNGVRLNLTNLVINAASYNSEADLYIGGVGAFRTAHVVLKDVDVIGGDYGVGAYSGGQIGIDSNVSITGFGVHGLVSARASVIHVFDTVTITGGNNQDWTISEAVSAQRGGVVEFNDDGNPATRHSITPASGPNLSIDPDDNVAAVSAFANGTIRIRDADITGVVWSGDGSWVDVRSSVQRDGYVNPYRNSVLRFWDSSIGNGSAADMTFYAGDFSVLRMDNTTVGNDSGTETANTYRYGVIDLRGTTDFGGRDIFCDDGRELSIRVDVTNVGTISCP